MRLHLIGSFLNKFTLKQVYCLASTGSVFQISLFSQAHSMLEAYGPVLQKLTWILRPKFISWKWERITLSFHPKFKFANYVALLLICIVRSYVIPNLCGKIYCGWENGPFYTCFFLNMCIAHRIRMMIF